VGLDGAPGDVRTLSEQSPKNKVQTMETWKNQYKEELASCVDHFVKNWDQETDYTRAAFCILVMETRTENAIALLVQHMEFRYSTGTTPFGIITRYPGILAGRLALDALIKIGMPALEPAVSEMIRRIDVISEKDTPDYDSQIRFLTRALRAVTTKILGNELAIPYLNLKLQAEDVGDKSKVVIASVIKEITSAKDLTKEAAERAKQNETPPPEGAPTPPASEAPAPPSDPGTP